MRALAMLVMPAAFAAAWLAATTASGAPARRTAKLAYVHPEGLGCPDPRAVADAVAARLGYEPFEPNAPRRIDATITVDGPALRGVVTLTEDGQVVGARELTSETGDCAELGSALALAISIAVDPLSFGAPRPPVDSPKAPKGPEPTPEEPLRPAPPPPPSPEMHVRLGATGIVAFGATPGATAGAGVFGGLAWRRFAIELEGRALIPSSESSAAGSVRAGLLEAMLVPCGRLTPVLLCAVIAVGSLQGKGEDVRRPRDDATFYAAAGGRLAVELPLSATIGVRGSAELLAPMVRTVLSVGDTDVWTTPAVSAALGIGLLGTIP